MSSTRLPGKVLRPLGEGTVLSEVLRRCRAIPGIDAVCCAVPAAPESAPQKMHSSAAPGTVAQVIQAGYLIGERVLRPAMVAVAKAAPRSANDNRNG